MEKSAGSMYGEMKVFCGRAHPVLAKEICDYLGLDLGKLETFNFSDGEIFCQIQENVRGRDVFVIQPTCPPVNENIVELLIILDALKRSSAGRVTAVLPYYGYGRQDKKDQPHVPITAKLMADLITSAGADRILTMDLHASQIQGFFNVPVDHLFAAPVLLDSVREMEIPDLTLVSPDAGGVERARVPGWPSSTNAEWPRIKTR
jgi:ribose-phosphate pyrophosphokinase